MDKIAKAFKKLSEKERERIKEILVRLEKGAMAGLDIKKLKGRDDIFRVRVGNLRIIYRSFNKDIYILAIERRNDTTYHL